MARYVLRKSPAAPPTPQHVLVGAFNRQLSVLRPLPRTLNRGPLKGQPLGEMPKELTAAELLAGQDAPRQLGDVTRNLFTTPGERAVWTGIVDGIVRGACNEVELRKQLFLVVKSSPIDPVVGKTLLRRSVQWYQSCKNSR